MMAVQLWAVFFINNNAKSNKKGVVTMLKTKGLDVITIFKCLDQLEQDLLGKGRKWGSKNKEQRKILSLYVKYKGLLQEITGLKAKSSDNADVLNKFLTDEKFAPMFKPFKPDEFGVVSILDKMVKWLEGVAKLVSIHGLDGNTYPGFEIPDGGVNIYRTTEGLLAKLGTKSNDNLWLLLPTLDREIDEIGMIKLAFDVMSQQLDYSGDYAGAQIPKIDFDLKPDISWLVGADTNDEKGQYWFVAQAYQQFKMRMDETGARVKVATGLGVMRGISRVPAKLIFNRPFYGWWTQKGLEELPMAVFCAGYDCWKNPAGRLEDL